MSTMIAYPKTAYVAIDIGKNVHWFGVYTGLELETVQAAVKLRSNQHGLAQVCQIIDQLLGSGEYDRVVLGHEPTGIYHENWTRALLERYEEYRQADSHPQFEYRLLNPLLVKKERETMSNGRSRKTDPLDVQRLCAYLWPDQTHRMELTRAAIAVQETPVARAEGVRGVHAITLDASCGDPSVPATTTVAPSTTEAPTTTAAPSTTEAPTTTAAPTTTTVTWPLLAVWLDGGVIALTGAVANEDQRAQLVAAAGEAVTPANVSDQLLVDGTSTISDDLVIALGELATAMPAGLVAGTAAFDGTTIAVQGTYASDDLRAQFEAAAAEVPGVVVTLQPRPTATAEQAAALEAELNALVAAEPILFDKGSTTISDASQSTLVKVAGLAERYAGVAIQVQGHTDSEGDAGRNLTLSEDRAAAVLDALVALGVPAADLTAAGFGETELIVGPDGKEDPVASRRVVFAVVVRQP